MSYSPISANDVVSREATVVGNLEPVFRLKAGGAISAHRLVAVASDGDVEQGTANSTAIIGANHSALAVASGQFIDVATGKTVLIADDVISAGDYLKCGDSGRAIRAVSSAYAGQEIHEAGVGAAFTNQPANDGVEVVSDDAGDTTQTFTVIGTTTGTDTVVVESKALNGTNAVSTTKTNWGVILAVKLDSVADGTVTFREASGNQTIVTLATTVLSAGVEEVDPATAQAYNVAPVAVADGASTKQIGIQGTNSAGTTIYDSQALDGTTPVIFNSAFKTVTEVYTGDVENTVVATISTTATVDSPDVFVGKAYSAATAQGDRIGAFVNGA